MIMIVRDDDDGGGVDDWGYVLGCIILGRLVLR